MVNTCCPWLNKWRTPWLHITEKNQRKFSIEIWRYCLERYLLWHFKNLFFYFQNIIPKLYFLLALLQTALWLWNANNETAGQAPWGHPPAMSKVLPFGHRPCSSSLAALVRDLYARQALGMWKWHRILFWKQNVNFEEHKNHACIHLAATREHLDFYMSQYNKHLNPWKPRKKRDGSVLRSPWSLHPFYSVLCPISTLCNHISFQSLKICQRVPTWLPDFQVLLFLEPVNLLIRY